MNKILFGALAGFVATIPMTLFMKIGHNNLPEREKYPMPPREIFDEVTAKIAIQDDLSDDEKFALAGIGHFAYGATTGAIYACLIDKPNAANGTAYGLSVWGISYLGLLPALKILRPATEHPARRNALMISAHIIWGAVLAETLAKLKK